MGSLCVFHTTMHKVICLAAILLFFPRARSASSDYALANMSAAVAPFDLLVWDTSPFALEKRQERVCEVPGGRAYFNLFA
jgi:hypothetical protein